MDHIMKQHKNPMPINRYATLDTGIVCDLLLLDSHNTQQKMDKSEFGEKMEILLRSHDISAEMDKTNFTMQLKPLQFDALIQGNCENAEHLASLGPYYRRPICTKPLIQHDFLPGGTSLIRRET